MFRGLTQVSVDEKGRMAVPVRYRETIVDQAEGWLVLTIDTEERCLLLYTYPRWEQIEEKLQDLSSFNSATRRIQRLLIGHATELEIDRQGRILLPSLLREYAGIDKGAMLVGQGRKFEIWGEAQWQLNRDAWLAEDTPEGEMPDELASLSL